MKKLSLFILIVGTASMSVSCKESAEVKHSTEQVQDGRQPSSIEEQQKAQEHEQYLEQLDKGVTN